MMNRATISDKIRQHPLAFMMTIALLLRLGWFFYILSISSNGFMLADSAGYIQIAENIAEGNPYSMSTESPYYPDVFRTPVLPVLFLLCGRKLVIFILLQIAVSLLCVYFTWKLAQLITPVFWVSCLAGLVVAIDIPSVVFSCLVMAETFFTLFVLAAFYFMLKAPEEKTTKYFLISSFLFGMAALTRPIGIFLPLFFLPVVIFILKKQEKSFLRGAVSFLFPWSVLCGGWMIRNYFLFGSFFFSHISSFNLVYFTAGTIRSQTEGITLNEARMQLFEEAAEKMEVSPYENPDLFWSNIRDISLMEISKHPGLFVSHAAKANFRLFFYPMSGFINQAQTGMHPKYAWKKTELYNVTLIFIV
ncbi:MAG: ArnT family glycosyltransferase, partial [Bacteroidota bacterium]